MNIATAPRQFFFLRCRAMRVENPRGGDRGRPIGVPPALEWAIATLVVRRDRRSGFDVLRARVESVEETKGIATAKEVEERLEADAQVLQVKEAAKTSAVFDFSPQHEVNKELGIK